MKTIKTITILIIYLFTLAGTQTTHAQAKEETIAWIKKKLEQYRKNDKTKAGNITVTPCRISWEEIWYKENTRRYNTVLSFNPAAAGMWMYKMDEDGNIIIISEARIIEDDSPSGKDYYYSEFYIRNGEKDLGVNMTKALNHLATFCEKKKEAF